MTLHASKGLEFDTVFIIGVNQGLIPLQCRSFEQEEEERRLFFVGITRAENNLELSWYTNPGEPGAVGEPSRYLRMIPEQLLNREGSGKTESERSGGSEGRDGRKSDLHQLRKQVQEQIRLKRESVQKKEKESKVIRVRHRKYGEGILILGDSGVGKSETAVELVKPLLEGFPTLEALSSFEFFQKGLVENPVPSNNHIEPFVGHVRELWTYYCCSQESRVPNRFIAMPSRRNRIMGVLAYVYDLSGFLQWGFNFYYAQYSRKPIDPFACTDAGGAFPAGDSFLVYPGSNGEPLDSIRHEVFRDGLQDLRALKLLEQKIGREAVLAFLKQGRTERFTMTDYPRDPEYLLELRPRIYAELAKA